MSNTEQFGLTLNGFVPMQQQDIIQDMTPDLQTTFGSNINLGAESVLGQLVAIFTERLALLWQLGEAIYAARYPSGAEGTSVDDLLSLNNLRRLPATPTVTNPEPLVQNNLITLNGLVLFGTAGTMIPAGSQIKTTATPPLTFTLDNPVTIAAAQNAVQSVFFGNTPDSGSFRLGLVDPTGFSFDSPILPYNILANQTQLVWLTVPTTGQFKINVNQAGGSLTTGFISFSANALAVQNAIRALAGYGAVNVSGSFVAGFVISWGSIANPVTIISSSTLDHNPTVIDSVQAGFNNLLNTNTNQYPYTDLVVTGSFVSGMVFSFGAGTVIGSNPNSQMQPEAIMTLVANLLQMGSTVTNINIQNTTSGAPAQGIGTATATVNGPSFVAAGNLSVIGSPVTGWSGVTNQLDTITGTNVETDTEALIRRSEVLAENANGPIQAIVEKVQLVNGVSQAKGFVNLTGAAQQNYSFASIPVTGTYALEIGGQTTSLLAYNANAAAVQSAIRALVGYNRVLVTGVYTSGFVIDFNGAFGGQAQDLGQVVSNTTGVSATMVFGRPPNSFEIVVIGGSDQEIAKAIYGSMPAGIQSYGSTTVQITDVFNNLQFISFSRPTQIPIYIVVDLVTDHYLVPGDNTSGFNPNSLFNPTSIADIQADLITIGNAVKIGGIVIGFGTNGLIGAFNSIPGIVQYTLNFGVAPGPSGNANIQMQAEQVPLFETFNVVVSWT